MNNKIKKKKNIKVFVSPSKKKIFTVTKAPIAHKNWSKEQYKFDFYNFKISIKGVFSNKNKKNELAIKTVKQSLVAMLITKNNFPRFETNIFFLKNYKSFLSFSDANYFNYYYFSKKNSNNRLKNK